MRHLIIVLVCWFVAFNVSAKAVGCQQQYCVAVVDAGSTGSRLHIYAYDLDNNNNPVQIHEQWSKKIKPGFATLDPTQKVVNAYLNTLFDKPPVQNIPVYFYATAGMRLLSDTKQRAYYQALQQWFSKQSQWQLIDSKTITGGEEGVFGWLAVNYQLGALSSNAPLVNVMDMGGASVQVTLPVQDVENIDSHDLFEVDLYGRHLILFAHSFLGLGQTVLSQQFLDAETCFSEGYPLPSGLLGKGDAQLCQQSISKFIKTHGVDRIVKPAAAKNTNKAWYVMGGLAALLETKPILFEKKFTNQGLLEKADTEACHRQWQDLNDENPNNEYLYGTCLFSSYYYALMVDGYGLQPEEFVNYIPSKQGLDWSLGVVLHQPTNA